MSSPSTHEGFDLQLYRHTEVPPPSASGQSASLVCQHPASTAALDVEVLRPADRARPSVRRSERRADATAPSVWSVGR